MATITNEALWDGLRAKFPTFASHTSKGTADLFTARGYEQLKADNPTALDEFYELSVKVYTQFIDTDRATDDLENKGFGESYNVPYGQIIQRISTEPTLPVSPAYKGLKNGESIDPFVVWKPEVSQRFFTQNFDYQSLITMPDDYVYKTIFTTEGGMDGYLRSQIMASLDAGYTAQKYLNKLNAISAYLNSTDHPLKDTQKYNWSAAKGAETADDLRDFIMLINDLVEAMTMGPYNNAFNALGHNNVQDASRLKLLIRPGYKNRINAVLMSNTYHDDRLNMPVDMIVVKNFGGLIPTSDGETEVYPVYDALGHEIGFNTEKNASEVSIKKSDVIYKDPNADTVALLADKGLLFEGIQNPYTIEPIRNPRGKYTNFWASSPNNTVAVDALYNAAVITENTASAAKKRVK